MKNRIKEIRKANQLTLQAVADIANTTAAQIMRLEKGERRLTTGWMERLAPALNCLPSELLSEASSERNLDPTLIKDLQRALFRKLYNDDLWMPEGNMLRLLEGLNTIAARYNHDQDAGTMTEAGMDILDLIRKEQERFESDTHD